MNKRQRTGWRIWLSLLLCMAGFASAALPAWADESDVAGVEGGIEITDEYAAEVASMRGGSGFVDKTQLQMMVEKFIKERGINPKNIGIGFCYTATGDEFFYKGDTWFYPGSVYKVPLMMLMAEKVSSGQLEPDSEIMGMKLSQIEEYILTYSNNDWAHNIRKYLHEGAGDAVWRESAKAYANMPDGLFDPDYLDYGYQSPQYITRTLETLYYGGEERFPNIIPCLLKANPVNYFRLSDQMQQYDIAQKYGSFVDNSNRNWNCTVGIIYTENPIILSVLTVDVDKWEKNVSDLAVMFTEYAEGLDGKLADYRAAEAAREAEEAAAAQAAEEARLAQEAEKAAQQTAPDQQSAVAVKERKMNTATVAIIVAVAAAVVVAALAIITAREKKRRRYEEFRRRFEEELRFEEEQIAEARQRNADRRDR